MGTFRQAGQVRGSPWKKARHGHCPSLSLGFLMWKMGVMAPPCIVRLTEREYGSVKGKALPDKGLTIVLVGNERPLHGKCTKESPGGGKATAGTFLKLLLALGTPNQHHSASHLCPALPGSKAPGKGRLNVLFRVPKPRKWLRQIFTQIWSLA